MGTVSKNSVNYELQKFDYLADKDSYIDITEWSNGEGYDVDITSNSCYKHISITRGELDAIIYLTSTLDFKIQLD